MELYKERQINPFASLGILLVQLPILIGLYVGLKKVIDNPQNLLTLSYPALHHLPWMQTLAKDINQFDNTLFGWVDLTKTATGPSGIYWPAMVIAVASAIAQFFQSRQLLPKSEDSRGLRQILSDAGKGKNADQQEVNAAVGRSTLYMLPLFILFISLRLAAALPLYWLTSSVVAYIQQSRILKEDVEEAEEAADKAVKVTISRAGPSKPKKQKASSKKHAKRRKKR
jgi:membrane protein insertase Oxa1/YidC/SpoIIIJ